MNAMDDLLKALYAVYGDAGTLTDPRTAHLVVEGSRLLSAQTIPGVDIHTREEGGVVFADITVAGDAQVAQPIHTCVGLLGARGSQQLQLRIRLEPRASAALLAHCLFPNAELAEHRMAAEIELAEGAVLRYSEGHYHGPSGGVTVIPEARLRVGPRARLVSDFSLTTGLVGRLALDYYIEVGEDAVAEMRARVFGHARDEIRISDEMVLAGRNARGLIKTRVAVEQEARAEVIGITRGLAEGARGHMDCLELVRDQAHARAEPIVDVEHPLAKITHEAAVGTVDQKQLETLMAHGLAPEQAVDVIITGMLR
jgi:Fe-S cluster assembly scaffold protein SufB